MLLRFLELLLQLLNKLFPPVETPPPLPPDPPTDRPIPLPPPIDGTLESQRMELLLLHNRHRRQAGSDDLTMREEIHKIAQRHAEYQASLNQMGDLHGRPPGRTFQSDLQAIGIPYTRGGENAAAGHRSAVAVMAGWKNSPGHNRNMLKADYRYVGFGVAKSRSGRLYWVTIFIG